MMNMEGNKGREGRREQKREAKGACKHEITRGRDPITNDRGRSGGRGSTITYGIGVRES